MPGGAANDVALIGDAEAPRTQGRVVARGSPRLNRLVIGTVALCHRSFRYTGV